MACYCYGICQGDRSGGGYIFKFCSRIQLSGSRNTLKSCLSYTMISNLVFIFGGLGLGRGTFAKILFLCLGQFKMRFSTCLQILKEGYMQNVGLLNLILKHTGGTFCIPQLTMVRSSDDLGQKPSCNPPPPPDQLIFVE